MTSGALRMHSIGEYMKIVLPTHNNMTSGALGVHSIGQ